VDLRLARYQGGSKGPLILSHGLGVSGALFTLDTVETNLVEYLTAYGYDVWNLENRASIELPSSRRPFTLDDLARFDYPAAVARVRAETGARSVQVLAHCLGAQSLTASMLGGWLSGVRSAVLSQVSAHVRVPPVTALRSGLRVPDLLEKLGVRALDTSAGRDAGWLERLYDAALALQPLVPGERCDSPVCRRITFIYGHLYDHAQLNEATHATLHETFGVANMRSLEHLALCARKGQVVDGAGADAYLPHPERMNLPIAFLHGADNRCFLPESTSLTYEWLRQANGRANYSRHLLAGYGHADCWLGKNAANDVFPHALEHLEATAA
jgi:cholesterol oxidase